MNLDHAGSTLRDRRIALLIDADNVSHGKIAAMLAELSKYGSANIRRAYGDWASSGLKGWTARLHEHAIRPIQQFSYSKAKTLRILRWLSTRWNCSTRKSWTRSASRRATPTSPRW